MISEVSVDLRTGSAWRAMSAPATAPAEAPAEAPAPAMVEASKTEPEVSKKKRKALTREQKEKRNEREKAKREFRKKFEKLLASKHSLDDFTLTSDAMALFMRLRNASPVPGTECTPEQFLAVFFEESNEDVFYDQYGWLGEVGKPALYWSLHKARVGDPMIMVEQKVVEPRRKKAKKEDHMAQHLATLGEMSGLSPEAKAVLAQMQQTYATQLAKKKARSERRKKARAEKKAAAAAAESSSEHVSESESSPNPEDDDAPKTPKQRFGNDDEIDGTQLM